MGFFSPARPTNDRHYFWQYSVRLYSLLVWSKRLPLFLLAYRDKGGLLFDRFTCLDTWIPVTVLMWLVCALVTWVGSCWISPLCRRAHRYPKFGRDLHCPFQGCCFRLDGSNFNTANTGPATSGVGQCAFKPINRCILCWNSKNEKKLQAFIYNLWMTA